MATRKNFAAPVGKIPKLPDVRIGIVVAEWNRDITQSLLEGALDALKKGGVSPNNIEIIWVPGVFELPLGAKSLSLNEGVDGIITLGCVIRGETPHFDFISQAAANGIMQVGLETLKPVIFGVLTTHNPEQALERAGGKLGNKGFEAGVAGLKMLELKKIGL